MSEGIVIALITLVGTLIGVYASAKATQNKVTQQLEMTQAVTNTKLEYLTDEVRKHNAFAERIPAVEGRLDVIDEKIRVANNRIKDLEEKTA